MQQADRGAVFRRDGAAVVVVSLREGARQCEVRRKPWVVDVGGVAITSDGRPVEAVVVIRRALTLGQEVGGAHVTRDRIGSEVQHSVTVDVQEVVLVQLTVIPGPCRIR